MRGPTRPLILLDKLEFHGSSWNGPARYFSWLVERLDPARVHPLICVLRGAGRSDALFRERGIEVIYLDRGRFDPRTLLELIRLIRNHEIDLLHLNGYGAATFGRLAALLCGKPAIVQEHWVDHQLAGVQAFVERSLARLPGRALAISEYAKRFLIDVKGIPAERITVLRNGIPLEKFRDVTPAAAASLRRELEISTDAPVVGIVGMLHENKGHATFLEAAALLRDAHPRAVFLVIGDGELRAELETQSRELDLVGRVYFLGEQRRVAELLKVIDIFVVASISEAAGLSLLEAMASGCAVVSTDCGGPGEILRDGHTGLLVPVRNARALAGAVEELIRNPERRQLLAKGAQEASASFDIGTTAARIQDFYDETLALHDRGRMGPEARER